MYEVVRVCRDWQFGDALDRFHAEHHRCDQYLHELRMLDAVIVLEHDRRITRANLIGQNLAGAHVIVLIEVDGKVRCLGVEQQREGGDEPNGAEPESP